jgi:hypothetical protein
MLQPDAWTTFDLQSMLGSALAARKSFDEAEPLILTGYAGLKQRESAIPADLRRCFHDAAERIVSLYQAWERPDEVSRWREKHAHDLREHPDAGWPEEPFLKP